MTRPRNTSEPWDLRVVARVEAILADHLGDVTHAVSVSPGAPGEVVVWVSEECPVVRALAVRRATTVLRLFSPAGAPWAVRAEGSAEPIGDRAASMNPLPQKG
jgi:hypothetical protein